MGAVEKRNQKDEDYYIFNSFDHSHSWTETCSSKKSTKSTRARSEMCRKKL